MSIRWKDIRDTVLALASAEKEANGNDYAEKFADDFFAESLDKANGNLHVALQFVRLETVHLRKGLKNG